MAEQYRALQGFKDILPEEQPYWRYVENTASRVAEQYGYRRIETPLVEETAVYRRTSGEGTDVVDKEMYSFGDRADKEGNSLSLTLRPEGTAGVVRAYLEHGMFKMAQPVKFYYLSAPMFRHDKPQAGRYREHHQFGCEALGEVDPAIDAELIGLLYQVYAQLGLQHIRVYINSIGDGTCRPQYIELLKAYYLPLLDTACDDCKVRYYKNPLRLLDCKEPQDQAKIAGAYQVPFTLDPLIVRGLDYYTRTVFEFTSEIDKVALNGGGRYDGLAEVLGGAHTPGIGFGAGVERIIQELKRQNVTPPAEAKTRVFVVYFDKTEEQKNLAVRITSELRHAGIKTEMSYGDRSRKAQMKQANSSDATYAVLIKEEDLASGAVTVRDLQAEGMDIDNKQVQVKRENLIDYFSA